MGKVGCLVYLAAIVVDSLGDSVMKVDLYGMVKGKRATSGFGLKVMLGGYLCVSGLCKFQISYGTIYKLV